MNPHTLIIEPGLAERHYWRDLWRCRELCYVLAWRALTVRYKPTNPPMSLSTPWLWTN
jgi:lipopolysaccharide transport system permease protein